MRTCIAVILAFALIAVGAWKLLGSVPHDSLITGVLAVVAGILEIGLGLVLLFWARLRPYGCYAVILLCLCGVGVKVAFPVRTCGCIGSLVGREYLLVVGMLGTLASSWCNREHG